MIVAGFGFRQDAVLGGFETALASAMRAATVTNIAAISCLNLKGESIDFKTFYEKYNGQISIQCSLRLILVTTADLQAQTTISHSSASLAAYGTPSVAEACALAGAGAGAQLLGPRVVSDDKMVTCALARAVDQVRTTQDFGAAASKTGA